MYPLGKVILIFTGMSEGMVNPLNSTYFPAKTQSMLKAGAKAQSQKVQENDTSSSNTCGNCKKTGESVQLAKCSFCEKRVCVYCFNVCCKCEQNFCPLCSVVR